MQKNKELIIDIQITSLPEIIHAGLYTSEDYPTFDNIKLDKQRGNAIEVRLVIYNQKGECKYFYSQFVPNAESILLELLNNKIRDIIENIHND